jgi:hypothetical protein
MKKHYRFLGTIIFIVGVFLDFFDIKFRITINSYKEKNISPLTYYISSFITRSTFNNINIIVYFVICPININRCY